MKDLHHAESLRQQACLLAPREHEVQSLFFLGHPREREPRKVNCRVLGEGNPLISIAAVQSPALVHPERAAPHEAAYDHDVPAVSGERRLSGARRHGSEACVGQLEQIRGSRSIPLAERMEIALPGDEDVGARHAAPFEEPAQQELVPRAVEFGMALDPGEKRWIDFF
ncbi:hypothetical protein WME98_43710 [Sorangium sp. So ce296]|uniref:hypothetical protein n=1 Tax=Sorangium sp. So ce296 TaxID=3133296 RepID=UPI003F621218